MGATILLACSLPIAFYFQLESWQRLLFKFYCNAFLMSWNAKITHHSPKPHIDKPHLFVANHTSIIDYILLSADGYPHATIAQRHGGILGFLLDQMVKINESVVFERKEKGDR